MAGCIPMSEELVVLGVSHKTAPVEVREKLYIPPSLLNEVVKVFRDRGINQVVPVSTCNRTEFYFVCPSNSSPVGLNMALSFLFRIDDSILEKHLYLFRGGEAIEHLFRVASGLDSMVVGEPQILGQMKDAYRLATEIGATGPLIDRIFHKAFQVAKRVRTETKIGYNPVSVSTIAIELSKRIFSEISRKTILVVGSGEMAKIALKHFVKEGVRNVLVTNRTFERAERLAQDVGGKPYAFEKLKDLLTAVDMVLTSTGSERPIIDKELAKAVMKERKGRALFIIDIAVPRDVDPEVNKLENVYLYDIDSLKGLSEKHLKDRIKEAEMANSIVTEERQRFCQWLEKTATQPLIRRLVEKAEEIRKMELERIVAKERSLSEREVLILEELSRKVMKKLIHPYIALVKEMGTPEVLETIGRFFGIGSEESSDHRDEAQQTGLKAGRARSREA